jgi:hypothetical protein
MQLLAKITISVLLLAGTCHAQAIFRAQNFSPPVWVQAVGVNCASSTTCTKTITPHKGNVLVGIGWCGFSSSCTNTFSDNGGGSWTSMFTQAISTDGDNTAEACSVAATSSSMTITLTTGSATSQRFIVSEVANASCTFDVTSSPTGGHNQFNGTCASPSTCSSGNLTTTTDFDLLIGTYVDADHPKANVTAGSGWTNESCIVSDDALGTTFAFQTSGCGTTESSGNSVRMDMAIKVVPHGTYVMNPAIGSGGQTVEYGVTIAAYAP